MFNHNNNNNSSTEGFRRSRQSKTGQRQSNTRMERGDDVRHLLAMRLHHFVSNVVQPPAAFNLFPIGEQLSPHYRLATIQDVHDHRGAWLRAMPSWEIANLDDGAVDGARLGGQTRTESGADATAQLAMRLYEVDSDVAGPPVTFKLFCIGNQLPPQYRLATVKEVQDHQEALLRAMPGCEIANLADGSVDGAALGGCTRMEWKEGANLQLAMDLYPLVKSPLKFKLFHIAKQLPPQYRLATVQDVHDHRDALLRAMTSWEIANLADGSVDGASYGGHTRRQRRNDVGHQLAAELQELNLSINKKHGTIDNRLDRAGPPMTFKLLRIGEGLPPQYRLATGREIFNHREALLTTMPGLESTNLGSHFGKSSCSIGLDWIVMVCDSITTVSCGSSTSSYGGGHYIDVLPDDLVVSQIWPHLISSLHKLKRGEGDQYSAVNILWKLRMLNKKWMNLVDSSVEWAAFRLANSFIDAAKYSTRVEDTFILSRDFLCKRAKLRSTCKLDFVMPPYPDLPDNSHPHGNHTSDDYLRLLIHANTVG